MTSTSIPTPRYVVLDSPRACYRHFRKSGVEVCRTQSEIRRVYAGKPGHLTWISWNDSYTANLIKVATHSGSGKPYGPRKNETVLAVRAVSDQRSPTLHALFGRVVGNNTRFHWLTPEELLEAITAPAVDRGSLVIAVAADSMTKAVTLIRGDFTNLVVPFTLFAPSGDAVAADFSFPAPTDYGRTIRLGDYEASVDSILYEVDGAYRKKIHAERSAADRSFGASLRRLRLQRGLSRNDFAPLPSKTLARIERNEVGKPQAATLQILGKRLGVKPSEIATY